MDKSTSQMNFDALETLLKQEEQFIDEASCFVGLDRLRFEPSSASANRSSAFFVTNYLRMMPS